MEEQTLYTVNQVAGLLHLPSSMIRYWDDQGLIHAIRHPENGYRLFSLEDIILINDIDFYRKLGAPIKQIKDLESKTIDERFQLLEKTETMLAEEIQALQQKQVHLQQRKQQLIHLMSMQKMKPTKAEPVISQIIKVDIDDPHLSNQLLEDSSKLGILLNEAGQLIDYGYAAETSNEEELLLWQKDTNAVLYYEFLLVIDQEEHASIETIKKEIVDNNLIPGKIIGQYLMSAANENTEYTEYYRAWIEARPKEEK